MSGYGVALFFHLLGVIALFAAVGVQQSGGVRLRRAATVGEACQWMGLLRPTGPMLLAGMVILLGSGLYLTAQQWSLGTPWIATALVAILAMAAVGGGVLGRRFRAIGIALGRSPDGPVPLEVRRLVRAPGTWITLSGLHGAALGMVWLMTNKPGWAASVGVVLGAAALGTAIGAFLSRRDARTLGRGSSTLRGPGEAKPGAVQGEVRRG
jgi:hypothetical protein